MGPNPKAAFAGNSPHKLPHECENYLGERVLDVLLMKMIMLMMMILMVIDTRRIPSQLMILWGGEESISV